MAQAVFFAPPCNAHSQPLAATTAAAEKRHFREYRQQGPKAPLCPPPETANWHPPPRGSHPAQHTNTLLHRRSSTQCGHLAPLQHKCRETPEANSRNCHPTEWSKRTIAQRVEEKRHFFSIRDRFLQSFSYLCNGFAVPTPVGSRNNRPKNVNKNNKPEKQQAVMKTNYHATAQHNNTRNRRGVSHCGTLYIYLSTCTRFLHFSIKNINIHFLSLYRKIYIVVTQSDTHSILLTEKSKRKNTYTTNNQHDKALSRPFASLCARGHAPPVRLAHTPAT